MVTMVAAARFLDLMHASSFHFGGFKARSHGSLSFTGLGHWTYRATVLGLAGFDPQTYIHDRAEAALEEMRSTHRISVYGLPVLKFDPKITYNLIFIPIYFDTPMGWF